MNGFDVVLPLGAIVVHEFTHPNEGQLCLEWPGRGFLTLQFKERKFHLGLGVNKCPVDSGPEPYQGRGWKQRMVNDAVGYLISWGND